MSTTNFFTSKKETRLWLLALATLIAIYSTIPFSQPISNFIQRNHLHGAFFLTGLILVGLTITLLGVSQKTTSIQVGTVIGVSTVYLLIFLRLEIPQDRTHLIEYGILASLIYLALNERKINQPTKLPIAFMAMIFSSIAGTIDEFLQLLVPNRYFDLNDILFNTLASCFSIFVVGILKKRK